MDLSEEVRLLALDTLTGGWFRYGKLSDGVQIRCTWQQEGTVRCLQVENLETGEKNLFELAVAVQPYTIPPVSPEDDGALRAELSEQPEPVVEDLRPGWRKLLDPVWAAPVTVADIPAECANCAPLAAGASLTRVDGTREEDPCEDCRLTYPWTWAETRAGDQVQGEDGAWYPVKRSDPSPLGTLYRSIQVVTMLIGDREHTYDMPGAGPVRIKLGEEHRAIRNLKAGFPGTEEAR